VMGVVDRAGGRGASKEWEQESLVGGEQAAADKGMGGVRRAEDTETPHNCCTLSKMGQAAVVCHPLLPCLNTAMAAAAPNCSRWCTTG
jgi:hypothetical protein